MYTIEIEYGTGDSFHHEDGCLTTVGEWESKDLAVENAKAIKEHYEIFRKMSRGWGEHLTEEQAIEIIKTKEWAPIMDKKDPDHIQNYLMTHSLNLKLDSGVRFRYGTSTWCGYFESLQGIRVIVSNEPIVIM
jgi:hypothetical protein